MQASAPEEKQSEKWQEKRRAVPGDGLWLLVWGVFSTLWSLTASRHLSGTVDEWIYVERGLQCWRTGSHQPLLLLGTMPLPVDVETLPLYLWERFHHVRFDPFVDLAHPLMWARMGTLVFWWMLLIYALRIGRTLGGTWAGRLAVALLACEPNLLAHATLATTDISVSACLLAFAYHYQAGRKQSWKKRVGLPALWFAALVLCKASGLVFGILCILAIEYTLQERSTLENGLTVRARPARSLAFLRPSALWKDLAGIVGLGTMLVFVYCGTDWQPYAGLVRRAHALPPGTKQAVLVWLAEHLCVFANAADGVIRQVQHNRSGQGWFLLGHSGPHYVWYYFPVLLTIKLSVPLLLLPLVLVFCRLRCLRNWACLCALLQLLLSVTYHVQIGVRFLFPALCIGIVGLSAAVVSAATESVAKQEIEAEGNNTTPQRTNLKRRVRGQLPLAAACMGIAWTTIAAIQWWPNGLSYTNGLWGDAHKGYLLVSDSNYDWGQGLVELRQWQQAHPDKPLLLWYFGYDPSSHAFAEIPREALTAHSVQEVQTALQGKYLAVSATQVYGGYNDPQQPLIATLHRLRPAGHTTTFLIYDFTQAKP